MKGNLKKGIVLIIISALLVTVGQLCWKMSAQGIWYLIIGFVLYALGALSMIVAFRYGELSVLHPMLSVSYILAVIVGYFVLNEGINAYKLIGVASVITGMVFLGLSSKANSANKGEAGQ